MKFIRNLPDVKYTSLYLLYFPAFNGEPNKSNNSIKKLIVQATFKKLGRSQDQDQGDFHQLCPDLVTPTAIRASVKL